MAWTDVISSPARGLLWALAFGEALGAPANDARRKELEEGGLVEPRPTLSGGVDPYGLRLTADGWAAMRELRAEAVKP